ncbi:short chain dehydrogenase [Thermonema rossianum]|jgi:NAD(P)-dependent dehydrogenase (short-subunit alcohol dehydrogenase family)|uniref:short chain dehydrogenase n=1 Tax=Thermonema rossianum TaxID=55505 RepID=UPI000570C103|nr:short chain dehydrogenase [Thermonema rossianum]
MKILVIGATGTIGSALVHVWKDKHEVLEASYARSSLKVDLRSRDSIEQLFAQTGALDAVVCTAGEARWAPFEEMSEEDFRIGLESKLMGQVRVVQIGARYVKAGGSITLTTGILADDPVYQTTSAAMVNGALHSFVKAASLEMPYGVRLNVVSPGLVEPAAERYASYFPGHVPVSMERVIQAYTKSVEGRIHGQIVRVY